MVVRCSISRLASAATRGALISQAPIRPIQLLASLLPRSGAAMKMKPRISARRWKKSSPFEVLFYVWRKFNLFRRFAEGAHSKAIAAVNYQQAADATTHAMPNHDHRLASRKALLQRVQLIPQDRSGIRIGVAARVAVKPELVL